MLRSTCNVAVLLICRLAAAAAVPDDLGVAIKLNDYLAVRNSASAFLSPIAPDFHRDLPDNWLGSALQCGSIDCINQKGDVCFTCFDTPRGPAWACVAPIRSAEFYLDSLRANLGHETMSGEAYSFIVKSKTPAGVPEQTRTFVRVANGTVVFSRDEQTCSAAADMLKTGSLAQLFAKDDSSISIYLKGGFVSKHREKVIAWLIGLPLISIVSAESAGTLERMHLLCDAVLASGEQVEHVQAGVRIRPEGVGLHARITPREGTLLARFMANQQPASADLLSMLPGHPVFACRGRAAGLQDVEDAYVALKGRLAAASPGDAPSDLQHALERIHRFAVNNGGHFASALVLPPPDQFGIEYLRAYEMKNAAAAKADLVWEMAAVKAQPLAAEKLADADVLGWRISKHGKFTELRAAFTGNLMLIASGPASAANLAQMIGLARLQPGDPPKDAVTQARSFAAAMAAVKPAPPERPAAMVFFSLTALLNLGGSSGKPGMESLRRVQPTSGLTAWVTPDSPKPAAGAVPFTVRISIPADELIVIRETILGDIPLLELDLPAE